MDKFLGEFLAVTLGIVLTWAFAQIVRVIWFLVDNHYNNKLKS